MSSLWGNAVVKYLVQTIPNGTTFSFSNQTKLILVLLSCTMNVGNTIDSAQKYAEWGLPFFLMNLICIPITFVCYATTIFIGCRFSG